jgi:hypothetical protein
MESGPARGKVGKRRPQLESANGKASGRPSVTELGFCCNMNRTCWPGGDHDVKKGNQETILNASWEQDDGRMMNEGLVTRGTIIRRGYYVQKLGPCGIPERVSKLAVIGKTVEACSDRKLIPVPFSG